MRVYLLSALVLGWAVGATACGSTVTGGSGGSNTSGGLGGTGYVGGGGSAGCDAAAGGTYPGGEPSCFDCACTFLNYDSPAGCADICDNNISGTTTPNFCNGVPALPQCTACIADRCGVSDPVNCH